MLLYAFVANLLSFPVGFTSKASPCLHSCSSRNFEILLFCSFNFSLQVHGWDTLFPMPVLTSGVFES